MMETKLWTALRCAVLLLLLSYLGSAEHDNDHTAAAAPGAKVATEAPAVDSLSTSILEPTSHPAPALNGSDTEPSPNGTGSLSTSQSPEPKTDNDTRVSPSATATPKTDLNQTEEATSRPQILPSEGQTTNDTTQIPSTTPTIPTTNTSSPPHTAHNAPVDTQTNNTSNYTSPLPPDSISTSKQPTEPRAHSSTSAPEPDATTPATTITTTITQSTSTSSSTTGSCSSQKTHIADSQTLTSPHTSQSHTPQDQAKPSSAPSSSPSAQAKAHPDTPSQLNVGGDTTMVHDSPTLDPLLAGLVTAFIITAVVITLLLFLKLRKRDNRPEFRRLQDLPMDDMMEDTPLSMYSY